MNFLGITLGVIFTILIAGLFWWMLHPPGEHYTLDNVMNGLIQARPSDYCVLVGLADLDGDEDLGRLIQTAAGVIVANKATIDLTFIIELPVTLPLNGAIPGQTARAEQCLKKVEEMGLANQVRVNVIVSHARSTGQAIVEAAKRYRADHVLMSFKTQKAMNSKLLKVLRNAKCDVIIDQCRSTNSC
jgi:hypothetical protein